MAKNRLLGVARALPAGAAAARAAVACALLCGCMVGGCAPAGPEGDSLLDALSAQLVDPVLDSARDLLADAPEAPDVDDLITRENRFAYDLLAPDEQQAYRAMLGAFATRAEVRSPTSDADVLRRAFRYLMLDHPELFYLDGVNYETATRAVLGQSTTIAGEYTCTPEEQAALAAEIDAAVAGFAASLPEGADDYAKAKRAYEWIVDETRYDPDAPNAQNAASVFVGHASVCNGYAKAFQLVMQRLGVPCVEVSGTVRGETHAWAAACLDGAWYYVDPTWGDGQFRAAIGEGDDAGFTNYDYLCVTTADLLTTHVLGDDVPAPACDAMACNYYVREGCYLETGDVELAGGIVAGALGRGEPIARLRFATREAYDEVVRAFFDEEQVFRFTGGDSVRYLLSADLCTIAIWP